MTDPRFWKFIKWLLIITLAVILISGRLANRISSTDFETMAQAVTEATDLTPMQLLRYVLIFLGRSNRRGGRE